ncbi:ATPase P [Methyloceanibacter superfactus]|uniref:ATPase P n=1 Tax=Methyloceanibacter superfactus TaxID=1774969 RepID=A0A1E3VSB3_9HYPH|nr:heavy metal translocating P-type ATPase [Methyloceanibacter superfactus]ODR96409.1 ATPase P [Methyloceanibacter superfactus]
MTAHVPPAALAAQVPDVSPNTLVLAVDEMHCGACLRSVERAALRVPGVISARASLAAKRVTVTYDPGRASEVDVIAALDRIGFTAAPIETAKQDRGDARQKYLLRRVAVAGFAAMNIMLLSIAVWSGEGGDMDPALAGLFRWLSALIALPTVVYAGQPFFTSAVAALKGHRLNMDVPISLAIILATGMSLYQTMLGNEQVYFDAAVTLLFFLLVGRYLDESLRVRARGEAQNLLSLQGGVATVIDADGTRRKVAAHALRPGDRLLVAAGERVAADGVVSAGKGQVDRVFITGETAPATVAAGTQVYAGTLNLTQALEIEVTAADTATLLAEISRLMMAAEQGKARYRRLADRAAQIYAPAVHGLGLATFLGWLAFGAGWQTALTYAIAVLIITCPCALALAVPAVQIAAASRLFRRGIMVKAPDGLERIAEIDMVVFDKTGTLTLGKPQLIDNEAVSDDLLARAAALAAASRHPSRGPWSRARSSGSARSCPLRDVAETPGEGLAIMTPHGEARLGSAAWCGAEGEESEGAEVWYRQGDGRPVRFRFVDTMRPDAAETVAALKRQASRWRCSRVTGPPRRAAARDAGIETWHAELKPAGKIAWLEARADEGHKVLMAGDGLNDAPALAAAHASISPATAADLSQRAADFVFQGAKLAPVAEAIGTGKRAHAMAIQNFGVAGVYNIICVPLAMAGFVTPLIAAIVMSSSSILVTLNAARLAGRGRS